MKTPPIEILVQEQVDVLRAEDYETEVQYHNARVISRDFLQVKAIAGNAHAKIVICKSAIPQAGMDDMVKRAAQECVHKVVGMLFDQDAKYLRAVVYNHVGREHAKAEEIALRRY